MEITRKKWLLAMVLQLIKAHDYQIVDSPFQHSQVVLRDENQEPSTVIYLLRNQGRRFEIIRLQMTDFVWRPVLTRDIRMLADAIPTIRKRLKASSLNVHNIYLTDDANALYFEEAIKEMKQLQEDSRTKLFTDTLYFIQHEVELQPDWGKLQEKLPFNEQAFIQDVSYIYNYLDIDAINREISNIGNQKEQEVRDTFHYGKPVLTYLFLLTNLIFFILLEMVGSSTDRETLIRFGALWREGILAGEYWRFFTPMFLHIGFIHMFFNSLALFFLGGLVERIYGSKKFFVIYVSAGISGTIASYLFNPFMAIDLGGVSAGASGAIFGCFGALLYFGLVNRNLFFRTLGTDIVFLLLLNLGIGFIIPMIDNYGHIGGLVGGMMLAMVVRLPNLKRST